MANKKISELDNRASLSLSDLMIVGDPTTGYAYKTTLSDLKTLTGAGVISFNGRFGAVVSAEGDYNLTQLGDVVITSPSNGQILQYNGTSWVNAAGFVEADTLQSVTDRGATTTNALTIGSNPSAVQLTINGAINTKGIFTSEPLSFNGSNRYLYANDLIFTTNNSLGYSNRSIFQFSTQLPSVNSGTGLVELVKINMPVNTGTQAGNSTALSIDFDVTTNAGVLTAIDAVSGRIRFRDLSGSGSRMVVADANGVLSTQSIPSVPVVSVFGRTGTVVAANGDYTTAQVTESGNLYFTNARARSAISITTFGTGGAAIYDPSTGILNIPNYSSALSGYVPYTGASNSLNLGTNNILAQNYFIDGNGTDGGYLAIKQFNSSNSGQTGYTSLYALQQNSLYIRYSQTNGTQKNVELSSALLGTIGRQYLFPDKNGTFAMTSDIPSLSGYVQGSGTINYVPKFTASGTIGNSTIQEVSGNVGIGVTPSAWGSTVRALQFENGGSIASNQSTQVSFNNNVYSVPGTNDYYISSTFASRYIQFQGQHIWSTAPSGTASNAITFTQAMTLDASGNLYVGATQGYSSGARFIAQNGAIIAASAAWNNNNAGGAISMFCDNANYGTIWALKNGNQAWGNIAIAPNGGNVGIGTTSPVQKLHVEGSAAIGTTGTEDILILGRALSGGVSFQQAASLKLGRYQNAGGLFESYTRLDIALRDNSAASNYNTNTTVMTLTNAGNVGIGTTSPATNLDVVGYTRASSGFVGGPSGLQLWSDVSAGAPGIFLGTNQRVGIGTTSPSRLLHVNGDVLAQNVGLASNTGWYYLDNYGGSNFFGLGGGTALQFYIGAAERMRITSVGELLIGKTAKDYTTVGFQVEDNGRVMGVTKNTAGENIFVNRTGSSTGNFILFYYNSGGIGSISTNGSSTSYNTTSDYRLKTDLKDFAGVDLVNSLKVYDYQWLSDNSRSYGVIAHELQSVLPYAVTGVKDGEQMQGVDYSKIVPILIKAIQELKSELNTLKK